MDTITPAAPLTIGQAIHGGFYVGQINQADGVYAIIVAPKAEGDHEPAAWGKYPQDVTSAVSFFDGQANTAAMAEVGCELAKWARGLAIGGHTDWYIPARDELELVYRAFKPTTQENYVYRHGDNPSSVPPGYPYTEHLPAQTSIEAFRKGGDEALAADWYWTSTQFSPHIARYQTVANGGQYGGRKDGFNRVRAVRRVKL